MNKPYAVLAFVTGALLGVSVTGTVLRIKYMKDLEREIDSVIEEFSKQPRVIFKDKKEESAGGFDMSIKSGSVLDLTDKNSLHPSIFSEDENKEMREEITGFYYSPENEKSGKLYNIHGEEIIVNEDGVCEEEFDEDELPPLTEEDIFVYEEPRCVSPEEFAALIGDDYDICNWTLYQGSDGSKILADDNDELVDLEQRLATVGYAINIGEYEEDIAHICNDRLRCVIEITEDLRNYSDVMKAMPYLNQ